MGNRSGGANGTMRGSGPGHGGPPQLMVLSEQAPALMLYDVLQDCESLREDRARVRSSPSFSFLFLSAVFFLSFGISFGVALELRIDGWR
jgi:hypothetical protein